MVNNKPTLQPPKSGITVRMYNPGFGDCLLLAFRAKGNNAKYMLIDFGVHHKYPNGAERCKLVAEDIKAATGKKLDFVAVTHQHTDHLYGFKYAKDIFDDINIDELWLAWTEDPTSEAAKELKEKYGLKIRALQAAVAQLRPSKSQLGLALQDVMDFEMTDDWLSLAVSGTTKTLEYLRSKSKKKPEESKDYRRPGKMLTLPSVKGIKVYVLGPPTEKEMIAKLEKKSETYLQSPSLDDSTAFMVAALKAAKAASPEEESIFLRSCPFDKNLEISKKDAEKLDFFIKHYGFSVESGHGSDWRRIENDWLATTEELALDINSKTNNTSLILAFELTGRGRKRVLLFAADAQVGNWLSWQKLFWPADKEDETIDVTDLLNETVLYKVGHHGSHNATLRQKGLELMISEDLVAMIPVDEVWANEEMNWEHPSHNLLARLKTKTKGRIIRSDTIPSGNRPPEKPDEASKKEWKEFLKNLDWDRGPNNLWIQYTVLA
jgi:beta-lactamase superfamily II metal-dependent hydrolase